MKRLNKPLSISLAITIGLSSCSPGLTKTKIDGIPKTWHVQDLSFTGPYAQETPETFSDFKMDVTFTHETGHKFIVPGYFSADGQAAETSASDGNIWKVKFVPPLSGKWTYKAHFLSGHNVAIDKNAPSISAGFFDKATGSFAIWDADLDRNAVDFRKQGLLQDVRQRYLQFSATKKFFIKTGAGSPENILAYQDFDGTYDVGGTYFPALGENQLHAFAPHAKDAHEGDPVWQNDKGQSLLGAVNYLSDVGVNAQYMVVMNVEGDGQDVWPWVTHDNPHIFDVSKLAQWNRILTHMDHKGIVKDFLLSETENETWFEETDNSETDFSDTRKLYYREMVARFGHLLGLVWNLGEENGVVGNSGDERYRKPTSAAQRIAFAQFIADLDPYDHAIVSHNWPDSEEETYGSKLGVDAFSGISLQAHDKYSEKIAEWTVRSANAGRPWIISVDEPLGWEYGARPDDQVENREKEINEVLVPSLLAGGMGVDWYFGWQNNAPTSDLSNEDMRSRHNLWVQSARIRKWWERHVPFQDMTWQRYNDLEPALTSIEITQTGETQITRVSQAPDKTIALTQWKESEGRAKAKIIKFNPNGTD